MDWEGVIELVAFGLVGAAVAAFTYGMVTCCPDQPTRDPCAAIDAFGVVTLAGDTLCVDDAVVPAGTEELFGQ